MPILACMERGPGPAKYLLPGTCSFKNHDPTKTANPAYTFGIRTKQLSSVALSSPGPIHYVSPQITRFGKDGTSQHSFGKRLQPLKMQSNPSPGKNFVY